jgi:ComF family protein
MFTSILNLFFPQVCYACQNCLSDFEHDICTNCRHALPVTNFHFNNDNHINDIFYGRSKIENATALLYFEKKGRVQHLIHNLKYKNQERVGEFLGLWLGEELKSVRSYQNIDAVIPVPMHKNKLKKRGYNQVDKFGVEIAKALRVAYINNALIKVTNTSSQVYKQRFSRWQATSEQFTLQNSEALHNKHILLVDDIITTGATIEACVNILQKAKNVKISVAVMAIA